MCRKLFLLVLVLGFVSTASAGPTWIGTVSSAWSTGGNWAGGAIPGTADQPFVGWLNTDTVPYTPLISTETIVVDKLSVGGTGKSGILDMTGGNVDVTGTGGFYIGNNSRQDVALFTMSGGLMNVSGGTLRIGRRSLATFIQTGGTLDVKKYKMGPRTNDNSFNLLGDVKARHLGGLVDLDYVNFGARGSTWLGDATMIIDSTAGSQLATAIDVEVDRAIANGQLKAYGVTSGVTIGSVTYEIVKSWDMGQVLYLEAVPEPATIALLGLGGLALLRRKR